MEDRSIATTMAYRIKQKDRQLKKQNSRQETFISLLLGLYSCQWNKHQKKRVKPGKCCFSVGEGIFLIVLLITFLLWFIFTYLWCQIKNDYHNFDRYSFENMGFWYQWSIFLRVLNLSLIIYLSFLIVLALCLMSSTQQLYLHWIHKMGTLFILGLAISAFIIVTTLWPLEWDALKLSFLVSAPYVHLCTILILVFVAWPVAKHFFRMENKVVKMCILGPYLIVLLFVLFMPLGVYSPCIQEKATLGPKPEMIGHRGAPMVAPENTEMSFRKSIEYGVIGLETDVTISFDGVPFLMHDRTLKRTTDIDIISPETADVDASMFPWVELEKLNSGEWFFERRPYFNMPPISKEDEDLAKKQTIFKFSDFLNLADQENKFVLFDLYRPPKHHPYRDTWLNRTLEVIVNKSNIRPELVIWLSDINRVDVQSIVPGIKHAASYLGPVEQLKKRNIVKLNLDYRKMGNVNIREYAEANITTNFWVIDEPWLFSLAWCFGAHSVTTNAIHSLRDLSEPLFFMTPQDFRSMWITTDVLAFILISLLFGIHWWREVGTYCCEAECSDTEARLYNKFRTDTMPTVT